MYCYRCGKLLEEGSIFCSSCGTKCVEPESAPNTSQNPDSTAQNTTSGAGGTTTASQPSAGATVGKITATATKAGLSGMSKFLIFLVVAAVAFGAYLMFFTNLFKTDEQMIEERINAFAEDYNSGDAEAMMEHFDQGTRVMLESTIGLTEALLGEAAGFDISYSDMFGLGAALNEGDMLEITIQSVDIQSDDYAVVSATMNMNADMMGYSASETDEVQFEMVKEEAGFLNQDWYIKNFQ